jgi:translation initiation factor IF-1
MVKNTIGGKNFKKGKKGGRKTKNPSTEFNTEDGLHFYGQVKSRIGGNTIDVTLQTGETVHATIPGRFIKKVWFNKDDLIVVRQEGMFYDVVQKITNASTLAEASIALNIKLDKDNSNIFRADIDELEDSDDEDKEVEMNKAAINAKRREKDKERDLKRREGEVDTFDRVISVVKKGDSTSDSESDEEDQDEMGNTRSKKSSSTKSSSTKSSSTKSSSTKSTESTNSIQSSESDDEDIDLSKPVLSKKKTPTSATFIKKATPTAPKTPEKQITGTPLVAPDAPKKKVYRETPEEIAKMMGFN